MKESGAERVSPMYISIITFTKQGIALGERIQQGCAGVTLYTKYSGADPLNAEVRPVTERIYDWAAARYADSEALLFIGALGIAVRAIAPLVQDKLTDRPVLVIDDTGSFVIPVVAGHMGGANELAVEIAAAIGAIPVITTSTDRNAAFSADLFAKENNLGIVNRKGIAKVSTRAIEGKPITLSIEHFPPKEKVDVLVTGDRSQYTKGEIVLCPKQYALGIGCKRGTDATVIEQLVMECLETADISLAEVGAIASIDLKKEEPGLLALSRKYRIPFLTFDAEILSQVQGEFTASDFVKRTTGVDNVCERAAMAAAGSGAELVLRKQAGSGVTVAAAKRG